MKINDIFTSEELSTDRKLELIAEQVAKAKVAYGNSDITIEVPETVTVDGLQDIQFLSPDSKLAIAQSEWGNIKSVAIEFTHAFEGAILDKKIEELLAISPIMSNLQSTVDSAYL